MIMITRARSFDCIDCTYSRIKRMDWGEQAQLHCRHPNVVPNNRKSIQCNEVRKEGRSCGEEGKHIDVQYP